MSDLENDTSDDLINQNDVKVEYGADFESAIAETGFGKFNFLLLLVAIPPVWTALFETLSLAYVFPAAQCDLQLTPGYKGVVNAIIFAGMILSSFLLGSLVDLFGRRRILFISLLLEFIFAFIASLSTNFFILLIAKFLGGFFMVGNSSALSPYLSEFHGKKYRPKVPLIMGFMFSLGNICLPLVAWAILTNDIKIKISTNYELHSWNLFLLVCAIPALLSTIIFSFMPESPKYLMSKGKNSTALKIFQKIYSCNRPKKSSKVFPVQELLHEKSAASSDKISFKVAWTQLSPLFSKEYSMKLVLVCALQFCLLLCHNTLRQWWPQIYQTMNDYEVANDGSGTFCDMMASLNMQHRGNETVCSINFEKNAPIYVRAMTAALFTMCGYFSASFLINILGKRRLLNSLGLISSVCLASLYFANDSSIAFALICLHIMCSSVCQQTTVSVIIELFPTTLRASALSIANVSGRLGSVLGNIAFPLLLQIGCGPPFFIISAIVLGWTIITFYLPNTDLKSLK